MNQMYYAAWAFAAGALIPVLAVCNGGLARLIANPVLSVAILFAVGLAGSCLVLAFTGLGGVGIGGFQRLSEAPPWMFAGGLIVAFYVLSVSVLAPRFGVGNTILFAVAAQIVTSTLIDQFGLLGSAPRPVSLLRLAGVVVLVAGLALTQAARQSPTT